MSLNAAQTEQLLRPVNPKRVLENRGQSHLAGWDVEAHLTRIFGFEGWDKRIRSVELVCEDGKKGNGDRVGWFVTYRCLMTLIIRDPQGNVIREIDDGATGSAENLPQRGEAHDFALKNAITYALKRCAKDLGDQFGLSLYNNGSRKATIIATLAAAQDGAKDEALPDEVHPDSDADAELAAEVPAPTPAANGHTAPPPQPARRADGPQVPARPVTADDELLGSWAEKIDEITSADDAERAIAELDAEHRGGTLDSRRHKVIKGAIGAKVASLNGGQRRHAPPGPPAEERGAKPVPTGKGDDGEWVTGFMQRLGAVTDSDRLGGLQGQVAAAARVKTISPGKATELSAAIRQRRTELQGAPA